MIRYDRLWATMEAQGMTQYRLIKHYNFSAGQIGRLKKNMHVSTHTLDTLCTLLGCDISDIIEYILKGVRPGGTFCPRSRFRGKGDILQIQEIRLPKGDKPKKSEPKKSAKSKRAIKGGQGRKRGGKGEGRQEEQVKYILPTQGTGVDAGLSASTPAHVTRSALKSKSLPAFSPMIFLLTSSSYPESILSYSLITSAAS